MHGRVKDVEAREAVRECLDPLIRLERRRTLPEWPPAMRADASLILAVLQNIRVALIGELLPLDPRET